MGNNIMWGWIFKSKIDQLILFVQVTEISDSIVAFSSTCSGDTPSSNTQGTGNTKTR